MLKTLEIFKRAPIEMAVIVDEYGDLKGIVTQTDFLEAIAGELPDVQDDEPSVTELEHGALRLAGAMSIVDAQARLGLVTLPPGDFNTLAGFLLSLFGRFPMTGEHVSWGGWRFEVLETRGLRISAVRAVRGDG